MTRPASNQPSALLRDLTAEELLQFHRDGVVCLRKILTPQWVATIRDGVEEQRLNPGPHSTVIQNEAFYALVDQMSAHYNPTLRRVVEQSGAADIVRRILGDARVRLLHDQIFYKESGYVPETPWHQDTNGACFDGSNIIRVWVPVDPVPRQTAIEVVRASHRWNVSYESPNNLSKYKEDSPNPDSNYFKWNDEPYPKTPDIEAHRDSFDIIGYDVEPGDVVVFNYDLLHHAGAGENQNAKRRAYAMIFSDDSTRLANRPNMVPSLLDVHGQSYQPGQSVAEFPEVFPLL